MTVQPNVWRLIALLALAVFSGSLVTRMTDPLVTVLARDFGATPARTALLASAFALPFALIQPILGPVGDALGKRRVILVAVALMAVLLAASAAAPSLQALTILRALTGLVAGGVNPLAIALVADNAPAEDRQVALSRLIACLSLLLGARWFPDEPRRRFTPLTAAAGYIHLMRLPAARILYFSVAVEGGFVFGSFPYFAPEMQARGIGGTAQAGLAVAAFGLGGLLYAAIAKQVLRILGQNRMVLLGGALCLLSCVAFAFAPVAQVFIAAGMSLGTGMFMIHNSIQTRVAEVAPHARGTAVALHAFHFFLGQTAGPVVFGLILHNAGSITAFLVAGVVLLSLALQLARRR
jgi:predicted MFS family arabinose efflux permease